MLAFKTPYAFCVCTMGSGDLKPKSCGLSPSQTEMFCRGMEAFALAYLMTFKGMFKVLSTFLLM